MTSFTIFRQHRKKIKKNLSEVLNTFENIIKKWSICSKYMIFQRRQKALVWSKGLRKYQQMTKNHEKLTSMQRVNVFFSIQFTILPVVDEYF